MRAGEMSGEAGGGLHYPDSAEEEALTYEQLEALSDVIMHAESDDEHWPFPVRRLSPFEMARVILKAGYRLAGEGR
jgi:hypothetical protein